MLTTRIDVLTNRPWKTDEVIFVTGSFDNWSQKTRLIRGDNGMYSAVVRLPNKKVVFKVSKDESFGCCNVLTILMISLLLTVNG